MICFLPPAAPLALYWTTVSTVTSASTIPVGASFGIPDPPWFTVEAVVQQTEFEREMEAFRKRAALIRLWSRLAFKERVRAARRLRPRAPAGQPSLPSFARSTCSQASRWMVLQ